MKKLISLIILLGIVVGCEVGVHPHPVSSTIVIEGPVCEPDYQSMYWASFCDEGCCYFKEYNDGWICEEAWCFNSYSCQWDYATTFCY
tara:strand:+ start:10773 stop:11036 length:264 start_codon:yes stop_codon:yes gene_type:complete